MSYYKNKRGAASEKFMRQFLSAYKLGRGLHRYYKTIKPKGKKNNLRPNKKRRTNNKISYKFKKPSGMSMFEPNRPGCFVKTKFLRGMARRRFKDGFEFTSKNQAQQVNVWHKKDVIDARQVASAVNSCAYFSKLILSTNELDNLCAQYKFEASTGTVNIDLSNNYNVNMPFKYTGETTFKNNSGLDVHLWIWYITYLDNTSTPPETIVQQGLEDYVGTVGGVTSPQTNVCFWPEQSVEFRRRFRCYKKQALCIEPGKTFVCRYGTRMMNYDPIERDRLGSTNYVAGTTGILFRVRGQIAHDQTDTDGVGYAQGILDVVDRAHIVYGYVEKRELRKIEHVSTNFSAFAVDAVGANEDGDERMDGAV